MWVTAEGFSNEASISAQSKRVASQSTNLQAVSICVGESGRFEMEEALERFEELKKKGRYDTALGIQKKMLDEDIDPANPEDRKRLNQYRLELNSGMFEIYKKFKSEDSHAE